MTGTVPSSGGIPARRGILRVPELDRSPVVVFLASEEDVQFPLQLPASPMPIFVPASKISGVKFTIFSGTLSILGFLVTSELFVVGGKT